MDSLKNAVEKANEDYEGEKNELFKRIKKTLSYGNWKNSYNYNRLYR